ncbi:MFS transporter [Phnomibacter sp. MR]|uniref:MFS transporter n=1 Tax=Phnomibacter sp. MR TaxID=3042318 RepID=UPI003A8123FB
MLKGPLLNKYPQLRTFLVARFAFIFAMQMVNTGIAWYLYELTRDVLSQGLLGLSEVVPAISLALYAGHVIDISDKRNMLLRGMLLYLCASIGLGIVSSQWVSSSLGVQATAVCIYVLVFFTGVFRAFTGPTFHSIVAQLINDKADLPKAVTLSSTAWTMAAVGGPVIAGLLIAQISLTFMFGISISLLIVAVAMVSKLPNLPAQHSNMQQRTWESVKDGLRYVWKTKEVLSALSVDMFAVLFGGAVAMLPVFAKDILHVDATGMGLLKAAQGMGTVMVLFVMARIPLTKNQGRIMLICVAGFGLSMIAFALSRNYWLSFFILLISGVFDGISVVIRSTILQLYVPDDMRGRVSSVNSMFINSSNELGQFESGIAARLMGTVTSVIFGGCMTLLVVGVSWVKAPKLRKLKY